MKAFLYYYEKNVKYIKERLKQKTKNVKDMINIMFNKTYNKLK